MFVVLFLGGRPYQVVKINIMNLNKQAKLFSQGMHPVIRIGPSGKWERIKEKPAYFVSFFFCLFGVLEFFYSRKKPNGKKK